ncbi:MAG: twin-arginine translocation signal domain-containing protein [Xanthobacteraceae bacterium]|nr:MAG: twin-arginine translocation signal domain-containing protein [Xanthobacteraceae bacterium]
MNIKTSRRKFLQGTGAALGAAATGFPTFAIGQTAKIKIGIMMPFTGTYAQLGEAGFNALKLALTASGGKLGGRDVEYITLDDESNPARGPANAEKLIKESNVDILYGTVHSGVVMGMVKIARETGTLLMIPNAGAGAATGPLCAPNIFRSSFSNWQPPFPMGKVAYDKGYRNVVTMTWKYGAGEEAIGGFTEGFTALGGKIVKEIMVPFPDVEFQANLAEIASLKPDAVFVFFAGGGAAKYVKDYAAAGLRKSIPLLGSGFLTEGVLQAQGEAAEGILTTLHYADNLDLPTNKKFRADYKKAFNKEADIYAVQGYDAGLLLAAGFKAVKGDTGAKAELYKAMEAATIDSPRGKFTLSKAHNPIQDIYLREVRKGQNEVIGVAHKALADPARGCKLTG